MFSKDYEVLILQIVCFVSGLVGIDNRIYVVEGKVEPILKVHKKLVDLSLRSTRT